MTRPSDLPVGYKVGMVVAFVVAVGAWVWIVNRAVYDWLPLWVTNILFVGMFVILVGIALWQRLLARKAARRGLPPATD